MDRRVIHSSTKTLSAPWLTRLNWDELASLAVCIALDILEYTYPMLMAPISGDILDIGGILFCSFFFGWAGLVSLFELVPGLDLLPTFTMTWVVWYILRRRKEYGKIEEELERWK